MKRSQKFIRRLSILLAAMLSLVGLTLVQAGPVSALPTTSTLNFGEIPVGVQTSRHFTYTLDPEYSDHSLGLGDLAPFEYGGSDCGPTSCDIEIFLRAPMTGPVTGTFTLALCRLSGDFFICDGPSTTVTVTAIGIDNSSGAMTASPGSVHPGGSVTATSITPCPRATTSIRLSLFGGTGAEIANSGASVSDSGGNWAGTIVVPLSAPPATYFASAKCSGSYFAQYYNYVPINVVGAPVATTTALTSSANPASYGQPVTLTATVSPQSGSSTPTGSVTFTKGSTPLGTAALSGAVAHLTTSGLSVGSHVITATYAGNLTGSSTTLAQTVQKAPTALVAATVKRANPTPFSATLTSSGSPVTNQTVTFTTKNAFGTQLQCTATTNASGVATCNGKNKLALSLFSTYTATFAGTVNHGVSTATGKLI